MNKVRFAGRVVTASLASALIAQGAYAAGLADLGGSIDKTDIIAGFMAVALLLGAVLASRMGIRKVLGMIK